MPAGFTRAQVEALARLAQLELDDSEIDRIARQLSNFLDYAQEIQRLDTTGTPPTASVALQHEADRSDEIQPSLDRRDALANAPDAAAEAGFFKVPRVIG
jgi:aspartyl-tRNA(Asn)/glutamyl-tRNA(Gln) amidotransferase subunit C